jgi:UDP:flavonoid glycosyltransferase YjiC (YdhE family)
VWTSEFPEGCVPWCASTGNPVFADQKNNAKKIATEETGLQLPLHELTNEKLLTSITAIINDSK